MNINEIKDKIVEEILFKDENPVDYNIQKALKIIKEQTYTNDDWYIFEGWNDVNEIEKLIDLDIDDILDQWSFNDSMAVCAHCGNSIDLNTYHTVDYWLGEDNCEYVCGNCMRQNEDFANEYIEDRLNNHLNANTILNLENYGFKVCKCDEEEICNFWSGLYQCANDEPEKILKNAIKINPDMDYIFDITDLNPFAIEYTLYHRSKRDD